MEDATNHRRRRHKIVLLNLVEDEIAKWREEASVEEDVGMWKTSHEKYKSKFSTKSTWELLRTQGAKCAWSKGIWFTYATPKFVFLTWIAMHNRLTTGYRIMKWGGHVISACSLCDTPLETRNHLFFECRFSAVVRKNLARGVMDNEYTEV